MTSVSEKQRIVARLMNARHDLDEALSQSAPVARYDPVLVARDLQDEISVLRDHLIRIIRRVEETP